MFEHIFNGFVAYSFRFVTAGNHVVFIVPEMDMDQFRMIGEIFRNRANKNHILFIDTRAQFLIQFADQRLHDCFTIFDMTAEDVEETAKTSPIRRSLLHENFIVMC